MADTKVNKPGETEKQKIEEFGKRLEKFDPAALIKDKVDTGKVRNVVMQSIVDLIKEKVSQDEMNDERAKKIADLVLQKLPSNISYENLMKVIPSLDDHFSPEELVAAILASRCGS